MNSHSNNSTTIMTPSMESKDVFDFFGLPRELRDFVYGNLLHGVRRVILEEYETDEQFILEEHETTEFGLVIEAYGLPQTHYLLLSRQLKHEYSEVAQKEGFQLSIDDRLEDSTNIGCPEIPYNLTAARPVGFNIYIPCSCLTSGTQSRFPCELAKREFKHHSDRILYCVDKLPQSRALSIRLFRNERETHDTCTESLTPVLEGLAALDHLETIGIYCGPLLKPAHWDYKDLSEPIFTWDAKTRK